MNIFADADNGLGAVAMGGGLFFFCIMILAFCVAVFLIFSPIFIFIRLGRIAEAAEEANEINRRQLVFVENISQNIIIEMNRERAEQQDLPTTPTE